jgi:hypothetical protein
MPVVNLRQGHRRSLCVAAVFAAIAGAPRIATPQPWVPPRGEGSVSISYQNYYTLGHYDLQGRPNTNGATHSKAVALDLDYGVTDRIALVVGVPFISSKYTGPPSYFVGGKVTFPGPLDDGTYHGALQDFRVAVRRMFIAGPVALTPFVGGTVPSHEYETQGEAVPGRGRPELRLGASLGVPLDRLLAGASMEVRYGLGAAPPEDGHSSVRSLIDLEGGVRVLPRLDMRGVLAWQLRNKGPLAPELAADEENWPDHDRFILGNFFNVGVGATLVSIGSMDVSAFWMQTVSGKNGAHRARLFTVGATWTFGGAFKVPGL